MVKSKIIDIPTKLCMIYVKLLHQVSWSIFGNTLYIILFFFLTKTLLLTDIYNILATTPVYPKTVDVDLKKFSGVEELPPVTSQDSQDDSPIVHFASNFKGY